MCKACVSRMCIKQPETGNLADTISPPPANPPIYNGSEISHSIGENSCYIGDNVQSCPSILLKFKKKTSHFLIKHVTREIADVRYLAGNSIAAACSPGTIGECSIGEISCIQNSPIKIDITLVSTKDTLQNGSCNSKLIIFYQLF